MARSSNKRNKLMNKNRVQRFRARRRILNETVEEREILHQSQDINLSVAEEFENKKNTRDLLRSWVNCHSITTRAVNDLLKILRNAGELINFHL